MALNRRNPIWPYLLVLACLFALSIAAPRGWQSSGHEGRSDELTQQPVTETPAPPTPEIVRPSTIVEVGPPLEETTDHSASEVPETRPQFEDPAEKIAENRRFDSAAALTIRPDHPLTLERSLTPPDETWPANSPSSSQPDAADSSVPTSATLPPDDPWDLLTPIARWSESIVAALPSVPSETVTAPIDAGPALTETAPAPTVDLPLPLPLPPPPAPAAEENPPLPAPAPSSPLLPPPIERVEPPAPPPPVEHVEQPIPPAPVTLSGWPLPENLLTRLDRLGQHEECRFWVDNVRTKIEQLRQLGPQECEPALEIFAEMRKLVEGAEMIVPRLPDDAARADLRRTQYAIVRRLDIWEQVGIVRRRTASSAAAEGTEGLMAQIERYETDGLTSDARHLAEIRGELQASPEPDEQELARRLNVHYRNANLRVAISAALINRLLPVQKPATDAVSETILGNPVGGSSTTSTKLSVEMIPDAHRWQFNLVAAGTVDSRTFTTHGPVTLINRGAATYQVQKRVVVDRDGVKVTPAVATVDNSTELEGLYTSFDAIPIIRSLVRNYACSQAQQKQNAADREAKQKVAAKATRRVDTESDPRLIQAQENFGHEWIEPLRKLALDPAALAMETTDKRLVLRSRLAGGDQLGANTPRPEAPSDSFASAQIHESTLNNLLDHLDLAGRTFTLPELHRWLAERLNRAEPKIPDDLPAGVQVTFAAADPIRVRCDGNHLELVLNIAEIRDGRRRWHDFEVRATYRPVSSGLAAQFERDGTIELGGQYKGKPEVALRGIFSKVLSHDRKLNLLPDRVTNDPRLAGLEVTQLVVEDGWIATAIGPQRTAARSPNTTRR